MLPLLTFKIHIISVFKQNEINDHIQKLKKAKSTEFPFLIILILHTFYIHMMSDILGKSLR